MTTNLNSYNSSADRYNTDSSRLSLTAPDSTDLYSSDSSSFSRIDLDSTDSSRLSVDTNQADQEKSPSRLKRLVRKIAKFTKNRTSSSASSSADTSMENGNRTPNHSSTEENNRFYYEPHFSWEVLATPEERRVAFERFNQTGDTFAQPQHRLLVFKSDTPYPICF